MSIMVVDKIRIVEMNSCLLCGIWYDSLAFIG
jgi:hypothetical protein